MSAVDKRNLGGMGGMGTSPRPSKVWCVASSGSCSPPHAADKDREQGTVQYSSRSKLIYRGDDIITVP